jgi:hypothetical protein
MHHLAVSVSKKGILMLDVFLFYIFCQYHCVLQILYLISYYFILIFTSSYLILVIRISQWRSREMKTITPHN